jgi:hypothetical protein
MMDLNWVKSSHSGGTGGNCVEVAMLPDGDRAIRDSKDPAGSVIHLTADQWASLRNSLRVLPDLEPYPAH